MENAWECQTVMHRIEAMAAQYPNSIAMKDTLGTKLTYTTMLERVQTIGQRLLASRVKLGDRVGVFQKPGTDWICSLLAIWWVGGVYVPLDLRNPMPRLAAITKTARPTTIVAETLTLELVPQLEAEEARVIDIKAADPTVTPRPWTCPASGDDVAANLFTSGSTGAPKGVILTHGNLVRHFEAFVQGLGREVVLQQSALSFDMSLCQLLTAFTTGGTAVIVDENKRVDSAEIANIIRQEKVTWTIATPSEYISWLEFGGQDLREATSWTTANCGGEEMKKEIIHGFNTLENKRVRLFNMYGPTEATIIATGIEIPFRQLTHQDSMTFSIGTAYSNYSVYVVDSDLRLLPCGFVGELYIGGPTVSPGYINNDELNRQRFLPDPFASDEEKLKGWGRMYKTGDAGRLTYDGRVIFTGRREGGTQIKLRGVRMDVNDIEDTLIDASQGVIVDAIVSVRPDVEVLIAHVQFAKNRVPDDVREYLKCLIANLPLAIYMRPALAIPLEKIPVNSHGKKDRRAVAQLELPPLQVHSQEGGSALLTVLQEDLVRAWRGVLPTTFAKHFDIGPSTDFFAVGGNSLLLVKLKARIREMFDITIPLRELLDASSLDAMSAKIDALGALASHIDWAAETKLNLNPASNLHPHPETRTPGTGKNVLLTGATGYFGAFILRHLVDQPNIGTIHCLAVRAEDAQAAKARIPLSSHAKIVVHVGDMTASLFGLSECTYQKLIRDVDVILHAASNRSFWDSYYELKAINVSPTQQLVRMAAGRKIPIHFLSSNGVLYYASDQPAKHPAKSVAANQPPTDGSDGYIATKWACEVYLEQAAREAGIPVTIHRFTPRADNFSESARQAVLDELVKCCHKLQMLPDWTNWGGHIDFAESRMVATEIALAMAKSVAGTGKAGEVEEAKFVHHVAQACLSLSEMQSFIDQAVGDQFPSTRHLLYWIGDIKNIGFQYLLGSHDFFKIEGTELRYRR